ncbi:sensor histidine kinase [Pseudonocardiaceae bacterium YIM PH 21723]|nr:sensor histidine kinase [Pseudonocardiaceae bacterium YIM PH 21723]
MPESPAMTPFWQRIRVLSVVLAVFSSLPVVMGTIAVSDRGPYRPMDPGGWVLLLSLPVALALFGWSPRISVAYSVAGTSLFYLLHYPLGPASLPMYVTLFLAAAWGHRRLSWIGAASGMLGIGIGLTVYNAQWWKGGPGWLIAVTWLVLALLGAEFVRARRERADQRRETLAELIKRRESEERLRIAREVHDVLAHHVSLIAVQAGTALHLFDQDHEKARSALIAIKDSAKQVLVDLRSTVGTLRDFDGSATRQPISGLSQLNSLVERMTDAGLPVTVNTQGEPCALPSTVDTAALRIIQESLTNTFRHAGPARATVEIEYATDRLALSIVDNGKSEAPYTGQGNGIRGMRERAEALGGTLTAQPTAVGFAVKASLPFNANGTS